jgi:hypothetical protein
MSDDGTDGGDWRGCFVSRPGHKIITRDINGAELRILCELSQEPVWVDAFRNGWDVHSVGAEFLYGKVWTDGTEPGCAYVERQWHLSCKKRLPVSKGRNYRHHEGSNHTPCICNYCKSYTKQVPVHCKHIVLVLYVSLSGVLSTTGVDTT